MDVEATKKMCQRSQPSLAKKTEFSTVLNDVFQ